jgi:hypothetical protein
VTLRQRADRKSCRWYRNRGEETRGFVAKSCEIKVAGKANSATRCKSRYRHTPESLRSSSLALLDEGGELLLTLVFVLVDVIGNGKALEEKVCVRSAGAVEC